ncbi:MAG: zf-HC2 domain-containing protein [Gemmatimonadaceae bacterium]|nr:zf-HC2 domain-containing protein [Gemmatimonadaceae bacterium]
MSGAQIPPLPPECLEVLKHVWDYLDEQLTDETTERLRAHIAECRGCFEYKAFHEHFFDAVHALNRRQGASPDLRAKVLQGLREEGFAR